MLVLVSDMDGYIDKRVDVDMGTAERGKEEEICGVVRIG